MHTTAYGYRKMKARRFIAESAALYLLKITTGKRKVAASTPCYRVTLFTTPNAENTPHPSTFNQDEMRKDIAISRPRRGEIPPCPMQHLFLPTTLLTHY